jgi:hypothetical protein
MLSDHWKVLPHQEATFLASNESQQHPILVEVGSYLVNVTVRAGFGCYECDSRIGASPLDD